MSRVGACPSCGSPLTFEVGSSRAAVCRFCKTLVVRKGQDFSAVGHVADVAPNGSKISIGATGSYFSESFRVAGRVQIQWSQGVWDEWYVAFPDERWGWLAEAQGRYYMSFQFRGAEVPPMATLVPGMDVGLGRHGTFVVTDVKHARIVGAEGELPDEIDVEEGVVNTVDLEGRGGAFATIDYGEPGDEPVVFVGRQIPLEELRLRGVIPAAMAGDARDQDSIVCGHCGKPVDMVAPGQTVRLVCRSCNALIEPGQGAARVVQVLQHHRSDPPIPIGTKGTLRGVEVVVGGWARRTCVVMGVHYPWDELVLYDPKATSWSWLVRADGHWSIARPISSGDVVTVLGGTEYKDKTHRLFSSVVGVVEGVLGEFPWAVSVGEAAQIDEYISPPEGLSCERNAVEISWSHVEHVDSSEVAAAFGVPEIAKERAIGVGPFQPWPLDAAYEAMRPWMIGALVITVSLFCFFFMREEHTVLKHSFSTNDVPLIEPAADGESSPPPPSRLRTFVSEPIALSGYRSITVKVDSNVDNAWAFVSGALVHEETGEASFFGVENAYYHGIDGGEAWREGETEATQLLSSPSSGSYIVRADLEWDPASPREPYVTLEIREGGYSGGQFFWALFAILSPLFLLLHRRSFEKARKEQSNLDG